MQQRITLHAGLDGFRGYGLHLIEVARHFLKRDIYPAIRPLHLTDGKLGATVPADVRALVVSGRQPEPWELLLAPPNVAPTPGRKTAFFTMWESSKLPDQCGKLVSRAEAIIVPSRWCYDVFKSCSAIKSPIFHVPLGVDKSLFYFRQMDDDSPTVFACAGRTQHGRARKGLDAVIRSFRAAFPYDKNVRLQVKCHQDCHIPEINDSRITVNRNHLSANALADWLASAHVFVTAALGEGWGLWQHQAMALGRPCIGPVYGGLRDFMGDGNCFPVAYREGSATGQWCGTWAYPDLGSMIEQMRHCHANRAQVAYVGSRAAISVQELSWERSCDELIHVLGVVGALQPTRTTFTSPKLHHGDYTVPKTPSVIEQCAQRRWRCVEYRFGVESDEVAFNPSIAGEHLFVRLAKTTNNDRHHSSIWVKPPEMFPTEMTKLNLPGCEGDWFEDPRAIRDGDGFAVSYTRVSKKCPATQEIAFLDAKLQVLDVWHPEIGKNGISPRTATGPEKNWIWFKHDGVWHCIHWLEPMEVFRVENGKPTEKYRTNAPCHKWAHGIRHGGAPPTRIEDEYFGFAHSLLPWFDKDRSRYFIYAYAFEAKPPFRVTRVSEQPLIRSEDWAWDTNPCSCVIAGGAAFKNGVWSLAIGARDEQCLEIEIPHIEVTDGMINV